MRGLRCRCSRPHVTTWLVAGVNEVRRIAVGVVVRVGVPLV